MRDVTRRNPSSSNHCDNREYKRFLLTYRSNAVDPGFSTVFAVGLSILISDINPKLGLVEGFRSDIPDRIAHTRHKGPVIRMKRGILALRLARRR